MNLHNRYSLSLRGLALRLSSVGLPLLISGCVEQGPLAMGLVPPRPLVVRGAAPESLPAPKSGVQVDQSANPGTVAHAAKALPVSLDTVLHLVESQNFNISRARAKVEEAEAQADLAHKKCLPPHKAAQLRLAADQNVWQQKAELSKLTADTTLEAATTYIDLVSARTGQIIAESLLADLQDALTRATNLAKTEPGARVEAARSRAEIEARHMNVRHFQARVAAATAKLIYVLGLDPCTELVPVDEHLAPFDLIDASVPVCDLVVRAVTEGPGIRELEGMIGLMEETVHHIESHCLIDCLTSCERRRMIEAQRARNHLAYQDLRAKLTAGVQEPRATILYGLDEIRRASQQVKNSSEARQLSKERLDNNVAGSSPSEVLLSLQSLGNARLNYLSAIGDYNKAQVRLLILTAGPGGAAGACAPKGGPAPGVSLPAAPAGQLPMMRRPTQ